jgi:hypothetical protein
MEAENQKNAEAKEAMLKQRQSADEEQKCATERQEGEIHTSEQKVDDMEGRLVKLDISPLEHLQNPNKSSSFLTCSPSFA